MKKKTRMKSRIAPTPVWAVYTEDGVELFVSRQAPAAVIKEGGYTVTPYTVYETPTGVSADACLCYRLFKKVTGLSLRRDKVTKIQIVAGPFNG